MKPKRGYPRSSGTYDQCETPRRAWVALSQFVDRAHRIWEPAPGTGALAEFMRRDGHDVIETHDDFFNTLTPRGATCIITNPPFSIKYDWIEECLSRSLPVALILPVEVIGVGAFWKACNGHTPQVLCVTPRLNYRMPNKGWRGSAQFPTAWFVWPHLHPLVRRHSSIGGPNIGITVAHVNVPRLPGEPG